MTADSTGILLLAVLCREAFYINARLSFMIPFVLIYASDSPLDSCSRLHPPG